MDVSAVFLVISTSAAINDQQRERERELPSPLFSFFPFFRRTLPCCPPGCISSSPRPPKVFPSLTAGTFSSIFHDGASPSRFSPQSFPADRRTPASSRHSMYRHETRALDFVSSLLCDLRLTQKTTSPSETARRIWQDDNTAVSRSSLII